MNNAAMGAARRLSVDVANLSFRLAVAESIQDEIRDVFMAVTEDGTGQRRVNPDLWQRRIAYAHGQDDQPTFPEIVLTEEQASALIQVLNTLEQLL